MARRNLSPEEQARRIKGIDQRAAQKRAKEGRPMLPGDAELLTMDLMPSWERERDKDPEKFLELYKEVHPEPQVPRKRKKRHWLQSYASEEDMRAITLEFWPYGYYCVGDEKLLAQQEES